MKKLFSLKILAGITLATFLTISCVALYSTYNKIVEAENAVDADWAQIDTQLQRRFDLIPNLVKTVKGYAKHEKATFEKVAELRSQWVGAKEPEEKATLANNLNLALGKVVLVAENYPELKANQQFTSLLYSLEGTENRISVARTRYNESINHFNNMVERLPGRLFGKPVKTSFFKAAPESLTAPKIEF